MKDKPIRAKVARILNTREIAINAGEYHGVTPGMIFDIMDAKGEDIEDPDTGEIIGSLDRRKVRIKITDVREKISVATTYNKRMVNIGGTGKSSMFPDLSLLSKSMIPPRYIEKYETFKTDEKTWEDLDETKSFVKTGDPVVQVLNPEIFEN